jgi:pyruvate dehydrogenase E1 component subunit alpha
VTAAASRCIDRQSGDTDLMATAKAARKADTKLAEKYRGYLRQMLLIRRFEEKAGEAYSLGQIGGFCHLYIGQEAVAVGTLSQLRQDDYVVAAYREHGHALVRGISPRACMAELFGKATGCSKGKGGSMHLFDPKIGFMGGHGIVGGQIPLCAGMGFAIRYRGGDQIAVGYFGEAAVNNGAFHEALNMAGVWKLPCIFICENNRYGMGTAVERATATWSIADRAASYDMTREVVDGQDLLEVMAAMDRAVVRARRPSAPTLLEIRTYRLVGHSMSDPIHGHYRTKEEVEAHRRRDPIILWSEKLKADGLIDDEGVQKLDDEVKAEVQDAYVFAQESPDPDPSELWADVYAPTGGSGEG